MARMKATTSLADSLPRTSGLKGVKIARALRGESRHRGGEGVARLDGVDTGRLARGLVHVEIRTDRALAPRCRRGEEQRRLLRPPVEINSARGSVTPVR